MADLKELPAIIERLPESSKESRRLQGTRALRALARDDGIQEGAMQVMPYHTIAYPAYHTMIMT